MRTWLNPILPDELEYEKAPPINQWGLVAPCGWMICGGESGNDWSDLTDPRIRPTHPDWIRSLRDQCMAANVPFFFKQYGRWKPLKETEVFHSARDYRFPDGMIMTPDTKKNAGNELDGKIYEEFPKGENQYVVKETQTDFLTLA